VKLTIQVNNPCGFSMHGHYIFCGFYMHGTDELITFILPDFMLALSPAQYNIFLFLGGRIRSSKASCVNEPNRTDAHSESGLPGFF
jgi:hypothetical protein